MNGRVRVRRDTSRQFPIRMLPLACHALRRGVEPGPPVGGGEQLPDNLDKDRGPGANITGVW
jgi:hypothetical protein